MFKSLKLIVEVYAGDFPYEVEEECLFEEINTHYDNDVFSINWEDPHDKPKMQAWLLETYGEKVKAHKEFAVHQPKQT